MKSKNTEIQNPDLILVISFFILFATSSLIIFLANLLFPKDVVLGNLHITKTWAIIHSMSALALVNTLTIPLVRMFTPKQWLITYFFINFFSLWVIARLAEQLGLGLSSWLTTALLALALNLSQGILLQLPLYKNSSSCLK
jgi:hypothetical protein